MNIRELTDEDDWWNIKVPLNPGKIYTLTYTAIITWKFSTSKLCGEYFNAVPFALTGGSVEGADGPDLELGDTVVFIESFECKRGSRNFRFMYKFLYGYEIIYVSHRSMALAVWKEL